MCTYTVNQEPVDKCDLAYLTPISEGSHPPADSCGHLPPSAVSCGHLPPPAVSCGHLPLPAVSCGT